MADHPLQASQQHTVADWRFAAAAALVCHRTDSLLRAASRAQSLPPTRDNCESAAGRSILTKA
jgi:hypothetical protein